MRSISKFAAVSVMVAAAFPAFAQGTGTTGTGTTIEVEQPWARATPAGAQTGAAYMTLDNKANEADRLTGATSDIAAKVQIHEMSVVTGVMQMRQLADGLAVPAGGSVVLKPGSYHVMLIGLKKPLAAGESFPLTLQFEKAGNVSVTVPVQAMGANGNPSGGMGHMEMK